MTANEIERATGRIINRLSEYLDGRDVSEPEQGDLMGLYTRSALYLQRNVAAFHKQQATIRFTVWLAAHIPPGATVWDVGCSCGITGLLLAERGYEVGFYDFEGLGLAFVRWYAGEEGLAVEVLPYREHPPPARRDWAIGLDVMEHTGNHLGFLRWMKDLGETVAFSVPHVTYRPPFVLVLDQWVDVEASEWVIERRYETLYHKGGDGHTFVVYR
jgi:cyclopropane fatty-acyl-phospholipid synthase-like methyltransferase